MGREALGTSNQIYPDGEGIPVKNAGIVLLSSFINTLFNRIGLTNNNTFVNEQAQINAVHYIQYIVTGSSSTEEPLLSLNKVLCGLQVSAPVDYGITISDEDAQSIESLIKAAIAYWPAIGNSSVDGFRGNWLVRNGILVEQQDKWELTVEKRVYDILINKAPFTFSIIKYNWMDKPLHVIWPY